MPPSSTLILADSPMHISNVNELATNACTQAAYDIYVIKPKHHWLMHVPEQIARDNVVLDAFVIERQHVLVKANDASQCKLTGQGGEYVNVIINPARMNSQTLERLHCEVFVDQGIAEHVRNTSSFERTVLAGVINVSMRRATEMHLGPRLLGRRAPLPECRGVLVADRMSMDDLVVTRGDVVSYMGELGIVAACYEEGHSFGVLVEPLEVRRWMAKHSAVTVRTARLQAWPIGQLVLCLAWKQLDPHELLVVCQ